MKKLIHILAFALLAFAFSFVKGQTINVEVKEINKPCLFSPINQVSNFSNPNSATADLFSKDGYRDAGIPKNYMGSQDAPDGNNYIGIITYYGDFARKDSTGKWVSHGFDKWSEYAYTALPSTLVAGKDYTISFKVSLADYAKFASSGLGVLFTSAPIVTTSSGRLSQEPQISNSEVIKDKTGWTEIKGTFTAKGDEKYMAIGAFDKNYNVEYVGDAYDNGCPRAYYYVSGIHIDEAAPKYIAPPPPPPAPVVEKKVEQPKKMDEAKKKEVAEKISFAAKSIQFETGKDVIKPASFGKLDEVVSVMKEYDFTKWSIEGYTDNIGKPESNLDLSKRRAATVKNYFINKGINGSRLNSEGFGESNPVETNKTAEGRSANRRVEIKLNE